MRNILHLVSLIFLITCQVRDGDKISLNGHWHCVEPCGLYKTLDIHDSVTTTNDLLLLEPDRLEYPRFDEKGSQILPPDYFGYSDSFIIKNDTLEIYGSTVIQDRIISNTSKYVRSLGQCELQDRYINSVINVSISESSKSEDYDKLLYTADLLIGTSIKPGYERPKVSLDSIFIQADDVFIKLDEVPRYCKEKESELLPNDKISLVLHADRQVNELFIQRLIKEVPVTILVYKAVNRDGHLSVIKLSRD